MASVRTYSDLDVAVRSDTSDVGEGPVFDPHTGRHGGREVRRYDPTGRVVGVVPVPVLQPSSCAFGPDGRLYITPACNGLSRKEPAMSGSVFVGETGTTGVPVQPFRA
ncbi:SMP-30/gluconolactonase/LRE family protein [Actinacidiphila soli]|uniref:SMP-30/gluconolactonase/LRE family protein n=1 Tax=Actinacidiphila soli TaxID=2487275 RepID=UPI001F0BF391|nr:SMP-30/gluconolactonase/LRE family protein [Actinacidiphila soli]